MDPDQAFGGGAVRLGGALAKKVFTCLNTKFANNVGCHRNLVIFYRPKSGYFGSEIMRFFRENHSLKTLYIINSEKV